MPLKIISWLAKIQINAGKENYIQQSSIDRISPRNQLMLHSTSSQFTTGFPLPSKISRRRCSIHCCHNAAQHPSVNAKVYCLFVFVHSCMLCIYYMVFAHVGANMFWYIEPRNLRKKKKVWSGTILRTATATTLKQLHSHINCTPCLLVSVAHGAA